MQGYYAAARKINSLFFYVLRQEEYHIEQNELEGDGVT